MKLEIIRDSRLAETLIKIYAAHIDRKTQQIIDLAEGKSDHLLGVWMEKVYLLALPDIIRIYSEDKKVFLETTDKVYATKYRIYQLEEQLTKDFIKISQGEIVNIRAIQKLDLSIKGTIKLTLKTGGESFVSRRSLKTFKEKLGL